MSNLPKVIGATRVPAAFKDALNKYLTEGAVNKIGGEIDLAEVKTKGDESPVHKSQYNRNDKEDVLSVRITPRDKNKGTFTHHVYLNGTGTIKKGDKREYSTAVDKKE